jgi:hypothetical protein
MSGSFNLPGDSGNNTLTGGASNDTLGAAANGGNDSLNGGAGNDVFFLNGNDTALGLQGRDDFIVTGGGNNSIDGGVAPGGALADADVVEFAFREDFTITGSGVTGDPYLISWNDGIQTFTTTAINVRGFDVDSNPGTESLIDLDTITGGTLTISTVCFAQGTRITTSLGEVAVEDLRGGDLVATVSGEGAPMKPVLWVGRRRVQLAGNPAADQLAPIRVKAGALGDGLPHRDLLVSPDHCLFLDGALVPARLLVNGRSIVAEREFGAVTYYHVELETHDVLLAEGAAAESWLDAGNRDWFENAAVARLAVTGGLDAYGTGWDASRACALVVQGGPRLAEIRAVIEARIDRPAVATPAAA